jgi:integrase
MVPGSVVQDLATVAGLQEGRTTARETAPVGPVSLAVVEASLPHLPKPVAGLVRLQLLTGMRPGEACSMRGRDLTTGDEVWTYRPASHKTAWWGKRREITLGPRAVELIQGFLRVDQDAYLFDPRDAVADHQASRSRGRQTRATPSETAKRVANPGSNHNRWYGKSSYSLSVGVLTTMAEETGAGHPDGWSREGSGTE